MTTALARSGNVSLMTGSSLMVPGPGAVVRLRHTGARTRKPCLGNLVAGNHGDRLGLVIRFRLSTKRNTTSMPALPDLGPAFVSGALREPPLQDDLRRDRIGAAAA